MSNVMVDLETLGNNSHSVIISLGAVVFDENGLGETFYSRICPQSCVDAGLQMDADTVMWWMQQSEQARAEFKRACMSLPVVLHDFAKWFPDKATIWGNGATFDNVILSNAYAALKMSKPWKYNADRCYRTLKALYPQITPSKRTGTYHNALDDAIYQADHAIVILRAMKS